MLISILKIITKGRELIRPVITRFTVAYLTLGCLSKHKVALMTMFASSRWKGIKFVLTDEGKKVQEFVLDSTFWSDVLT